MTKLNKWIKNQIAGKKDNEFKTKYEFSVIKQITLPKTIDINGVLFDKLCINIYKKEDKTNVAIFPITGNTVITDLVLLNETLNFNPEDYWNMGK